MHPIRDLALCIIDDREVVADAHHLKVTVIQRFTDHITDAFNRKDVEIDMISADINFSTDSTDPAEQGRPSDSFGLTHFVIMAMRRKQSDPYRNKLPFVWEIRTASPAEYVTDAHALRVYGLIRASVAQPREGESPQDCLWREYTERYKKTPDGFDVEKWRQQTPEQALMSDLTAQKQETRSDAKECARHLLLEWRRQFLEQVKNGECRVSVDRLSKNVRALDSLDELDYNDTKRRPLFVIPIANEAGRRQYDLSLFSVLADMTEKGEPNKIDWRLDAPARAWLEALHKAARGERDIPLEVEFAQKMREPYRHIEEDLEERKTRFDCVVSDANSKPLNKLQEFVSKRGERGYHRGMIFCFLVALSTIREKPIGIQEIQQTFALELAHENYWIPSLRDHPHIFVRLTPEILATRISNALKGSENDASSLGAMWDWLRPGLLRWLDETATESDRKLAKRNALGLSSEAAPVSSAAASQPQSDIT